MSKVRKRTNKDSVKKVYKESEKTLCFACNKKEMVLVTSEGLGVELMRIRYRCLNCGNEYTDVLD